MDFPVADTRRSRFRAVCLREETAEVAADYRGAAAHGISLCRDDGHVLDRHRRRNLRGVVGGAATRVLTSVPSHRSSTAYKAAPVGSGILATIRSSADSEAGTTSLPSAIGARTRLP